MRNVMIRVELLLKGKIKIEFNELMHVKKI